MKQTIIAISWRSGSGKSSIVWKFLEENKDFSMILNNTTRLKRRDFDKDYNFIDKETFLQNRRKNIIIQSNKKWWNRYWLNKPEWEKNITVLDSSWIEFLKRYCQKYNIKLISIFFHIDEKTSKNRMIKRWDNFDEIDKRTEQEQVFQNLCDYTIDASLELEKVQNEFNQLINNLLNN